MNDLKELGKLMKEHPAMIVVTLAANLNPAPILYFIFYNLLYGLVFSLFIPLYCLYKETPYGHPFMPYGNGLF